MTNRNIRDLVMGLAMIGASVYLWTTGQYTLEIALFITLCTLVWLYT